MLHFFKKIEKKTYLQFYLKEKGLVDFLAFILEQVDKSLTLSTTLSELPTIFGCKNEWEEILTKRLEIAPSKQIAIRKMIEELLSYVQFDETVDIKEVPNEIYYNQYRKVAYDYYSRGDNVTLLGLGYLLLKEEWKQNKQGEYPEEEFVKITNIPFDGHKQVMRALAEGATIALFLTYLESLESNINSDKKLTNKKSQKIEWRGDLKQFAELIDQLESIIGYKFLMAH